MPKTIVQTVSFKASPEVLFALYVNSRQHTAATGGHAAISSKVGGMCEAWGGA